MLLSPVPPTTPPGAAFPLDEQVREEMSLTACNELSEAVGFLVALEQVEVQTQLARMWSAGMRPIRALEAAGILNIDGVSEAASIKRGQIILRPQSISWEVASRIPQALRHHLKVVPVHYQEDGHLVVASERPLIPSERERVEQAADGPVVFKLANSNAIQATLTQLELFELGHGQAPADESSTARRRRSEENYTKLVAGGDAAAHAIEALITDAVARAASDIHINNEIRDGTEVVSARLRIAGDLEEVALWPTSIGEGVLNRFRQAGIPSSSLVGTFDGEYDITIPNGGRFDMRLSFATIRDGEMLTVRLLPAERKDLESLDRVFPTRQSDTALRITNALESGNGLVIVVGRTGDGKSTTLAAAIAHMTRPDRKVITLENPVETLIPGAQQIPITTHVTWAKGIKAILRSDPNTIMIGEIRDKDTALLALEASQTGHMVLTTLHANDTTSAIPRLINLGVDKMQLTEELRLVVAQRLLKKLCRNCSHEGIPHGCEGCRNGFSGRMALAETLIVDDEVRNIIESGNSYRTLREADAYNPFFIHAKALLDAKMTTLQEVQDALGKAHWHDHYI